MSPVERYMVVVLRNAPVAAGAFLKVSLTVPKRQRYFSSSHSLTTFGRTFFILSLSGELA